MPTFFRFAAALASCLLVAATATAQVPVYGANVSLEQARKAIAAGQGEARKNSWPVAIAVVDNAGQLVAFEKMDNTQTASVEVAQDKAVSAAIYRRTTKVVQDGLAAGGAGLRLLALRGMSPVEGGIPLVITARSSVALASLASMPTRMAWWPRPAPTPSPRSNATRGAARVSAAAPGRT
jgi:uncharacterized protein GlcG (DUF336 family)